MAGASRAQDRQRSPHLLPSRPTLAPFDHVAGVYRCRGRDQLGPLVREQGYRIRLAACPIRCLQTLPERNREPGAVLAPRPVDALQAILCLEGGPEPHTDVVQHRRLHLRRHRVETSNPDDHLAPPLVRGWPATRAGRWITPASRRTRVSRWADPRGTSRPR